MTARADENMYWKLLLYLGGARFSPAARIWRLRSHMARRSASSESVLPPTRHFACAHGQTASLVQPTVTAHR